MHDNERFIREFYDAMARGDGRTLAAALTSESQWIMPGDGILSGSYVGPNEIFGLWKRIADQSGGGLELELRDVLANDTHVVALVTVRGSRGDRQLEEGQVAVFEFADGTLRSGTFIYEDPHAYEAFWH
jgi:ketosteroid isomerase-like protein